MSIGPAALVEWRDSPSIIPLGETCGGARLHTVTANGVIIHFDCPTRLPIAVYAVYRLTCPCPDRMLTRLSTAMPVPTESVSRCGVNL